MSDSHSINISERNISFYFKQRCENLLDKNMLRNPGCKAEVIVLIQLLLEMYVNFLARKILLKVRYSDKKYLSTVKDLEKIGFINKTYMLLYTHDISHEFYEEFDTAEYSRKRHELYANLKNFADYRNTVAHGSAVYSMEVTEVGGTSQTYSTKLHQWLSIDKQFSDYLKKASEIFDSLNYFIDIWDLTGGHKGRLKSYCKIPYGLDVLTDVQDD